MTMTSLCICCALAGKYCKTGSGTRPTLFHRGISQDLWCAKETSSDHFAMNSC